MEKVQPLAEELQEKLTINNATCQCSKESTKRDLECLQQRVKAARTLLSYLKIQAKASANLNTACAFFRIKHQEGVGFVDSHGMPLSKWSKNTDISEFESSAEEAAKANDDWYSAEVFSLVRMVTYVMEHLVKRVLVAETEASVEKEKASLPKEMTLAIEKVATKIDEMEISVKLALNTIPELAEQLNNFEQEAAIQTERAAEYAQEPAIQRARATECAQEDAMQRERADEHEQEAAMRRKRATEFARQLFLLKQKFTAVKSDVLLVIRTMEAFLSSQDQIRERLISTTSQVYEEKVLEDEIQKLLNENARLHLLVDQKDAQLIALSEQLRLTSLNKCDE